MILKIKIYFFTKTEAIEIVSKPGKKIMNACERGSFYAVLFSNKEYVKFPVAHIYQIREYRRGAKQ